LEHSAPNPEAGQQPAYKWTCGCSTNFFQAQNSPEKKDEMNAKDELITPISDHGLLKDMDPHHLHKLASLGLESQFQAGQAIFEEKDTSGYFYLILSGSVAIEIVTAARHIQIETLHDGDGLGWSSLLSDEPKHLRARALTDIRALAFIGKDLRQACELDAKFGYALMRRLLAVAVERLDATRFQLVHRY
jgi:CRP/FNR family transcriptional regulator, cyclic AMP receptor protein